jgi:peroxiredoxin
MKFKAAFWFIAVLAAILLSAPAAVAQDSDASTNNALPALVAKLRADLKAGKHTEADLADDLRQFDDLLAAENGKRTELAANIILAKGMIYAEVFDDPERAKTYVLAVKNNYPDTHIASKLDPLLMMLDQQAESKKAQTVKGAPFDDFSVTNTAGQPLSAAQYKGKVVLVDFWATWCELCDIELPNVLATYAKYHDQGFEIIGVSLDDDEGKLQRYVKNQNIPWPQYFDGLHWQNKLAVKYGISDLPANFLIDTTGNVIATNLFGPNLPLAVAKALTK